MFAMVGVLTLLALRVAFEPILEEHLFRAHMQNVSESPKVPPRANRR